MDLKKRECKQVGIYGGTFDPLHLGHLNLAIRLMEAKSLDEVWFCPAFINPHKMERKPVSAHHREKMLELALSDIPRFGLLDLELKKEEPSYMIDTLKELIEIEKDKEYPSQFSLLLGDDALPGFSHWKQPEEIVKLVPLYIGSRFTSSSLKDLEGDPLVCEAILQGLTLTPVMDISSTEIRERIRRGDYIGHLVPAKIIDYIYANHLYCKD